MTPLSKKVTASSKKAKVSKDVVAADPQVVVPSGNPNPASSASTTPHLRVALRDVLVRGLSPSVPAGAITVEELMTYSAFLPECAFLPLVVLSLMFLSSCFAQWTLFNIANVKNIGESMQVLQKLETHRAYVRALGSTEPARQLQAIIAIHLTLSLYSKEELLAEGFLQNEVNNLVSTEPGKGPAYSKLPFPSSPSVRSTKQRGIMLSLRGKWATDPLYKPNNTLINTLTPAKVNVSDFGGFVERVRQLLLKKAADNPNLINMLPEDLTERVTSLANSMFTGSAGSPYSLVEDGSVIINDFEYTTPKKRLLKPSATLTPLEEALSFQRRVLPIQGPTAVFNPFLNPE